MEELQKIGKQLIVSLVPYKIFPVETGGQKAIAQFNQHLSEINPLICVTVRRTHPPPDISYKIFRILSDARYRYVNVLYFFTIRKLIKEHAATHLLLEHPYFGWLGVLLKWSTGAKLVIRSHNIESMRWKTLKKWWWKALFFYEKWVHRRADYNLFITDEDRHYAITNFKLKAALCTTITFGIELTVPPSQVILTQAKKAIRTRYNIPASNSILLFNGAFSYRPNAQALHLLITKIVPNLLASEIKFTLIICGKDIPEIYYQKTPRNIIIAGFVSDLHNYLMGADIFINPITEGGGIKTKLVEALAYNISCVSFKSGAIGISSAITGMKLHVVTDGDVREFCDAISYAIPTAASEVPPAFFTHFNWNEITRKASLFINS